MKQRFLNATVWLTTILFLGCSTSAWAAPITWIGGNVDWIDGIGNNANWNPADEPDSNDEAIFNTANTVDLGSNNTVNGLTMSGGIDLSTNDFDLTVDGLVQLSGAGTNLFIDGATGSVDADDVVINGGAVELRGGLLTMDEEVGTALIDINVGGVLQGNGTISFADTPGVATTVLVNDGTLTALSRGLTIFSPPPVGTLSIPISGLARVDLDGSGEAGVVNVNRNQTLDLDPAIIDSFNGTMNLFHNSTFDSLSVWTLGAGGSIVVDNGFVAGGIGFSDIPADTSFIGGGPLTQSGGTINVVDTDGTLQMDANFTMSAGSFTNSGTVIFNGVTNITTAAGYAPSSLNAQTIINSAVTINDAAGNFNWDGSGAADTTVNGTGSLSITANQVDTTDNIFGGTINLNDGGDLTVNNTIGQWQAAGIFNKNGAGTSSVNGDEIAVTGSLNVNAGTLDVNADALFGSSSNVVIAAGATADMATTRVDASATITVNGTLNLGINSSLETPALTGTGTFRLSSSSTVLANTTVSVATFDWDGAASGSSHTINTGVAFTINSTTFDSDGDMDDPINLAGNGSQVIMNGVSQWTMNQAIHANNAGAGTATIGGTARMILSGASAVLNVNGNTNVSAPITFGASSSAAIDAGFSLRLSGGNTTNNVNTMAGGTISGLGLFTADAGKALHGFGTINTDVDFDGNLFADDGTLTVNGALLNAARVGTNDVDGVLNMVNPWNTSVSTFVTLDGGELKGGTMTINNANGVSGKGLVSARLINNVRLRASSGTLVAQTAANDNDWDGVGGAGVLAAINTGTLELRDNSTFGFTGTVEATIGSRVFANGFALDFNPGSTLSLTQGTYESTSSTDVGGTVTIAAGGESTIKVTNNFFLTFETGSSTTLNGNVRLQNNNINIEAGATFSGTGALIIDEPSHAVLDNGTTVNALLVNEGALRPGNFNGIGTATVKDFVQTNTAELFVELIGTLPNQYDRILASQTAQVDGYLNIDIDEVSPGVPFVPALGQTFDIISSVFGVSGAFDTVDVSGMPAGLAFHVDYLANLVRLTVVNKPIFSADFDDDGDVDATDLAIWKGAYDLNQLGDADGDNDSDGGDLLLWQQQFGSAPLVAAVAAVPEPGAEVFSSFAILLGFMCRAKPERKSCCGVS